MAQQCDLISNEKLEAIKASLIKQGVNGIVCTFMGSKEIQVFASMMKTENSILGEPVRKVLSAFNAGSHKWKTEIIPYTDKIEIRATLNTSDMSDRDVMLELDYKLCIFKSIS